jgi:hypothetical protein
LTVQPESSLGPLGPNQFAQLRQLLTQLNATDTVREHHRRPQVRELDARRLGG